MVIPDKFTKPYESASTESEIYARWVESGYFNPDVCVEKGVTAPDAEPFSIVLPPPNVTGTLHTGHAAMLAIEDIMVRYNRMLGKRTLWIPGTDHAAIATQSKVEKILSKEGIRKHEMSREDFLERIHSFAQESHDTIVSQLKRMGASLDWSREAYTLDGAREVAVRTAFKQMYDAGLIYRGDRIVNWDPKGQTVISDDEVVRVEETTKFYYFKYGPFTIGTARPETKFADKYIVMHPNDERYKEYEHGQKLEVEWINGPINATIIKDEIADPEFGTGVMTITPWHSEVDFELAEKHNLEKVQIIDQYGKLLPIAGEFAGMKIADAREKIVKKLEEKGLLVKIDEKYTHKLATAERSGGTLEPQIMRQWFVNVTKEFTLEHSNITGIESGSTTTLKEIMMKAVQNGDTVILPERFEKVYYNWIENLHDWCISRQIVFGHRIPVWYCQATPENKKPKDQSQKEDIIVSVEEPKECPHCSSCTPLQDPDTLDTWFSSGLWTFSTLGWPEQTEDFATYHPTSVLETGYDIIFFWVARMILMSGFLLGEVPFKTVYFHGLVRDEHGRKMSKSLGNIVDPVDYIEKYSADALRMALIVGVGPGSDNNLGDPKVKAYRNFANKIWNASRFVLENLPDDFDYSKKPELTKKSQDYLKELDASITDITDDMENFRYYLASEKLYHYFWHTYADILIEEHKDPLKEGDAEAAWILFHILHVCLRLLHPFMPFITEEIWTHLPIKDKDLLMVSKWPV